MRQLAIGTKRFTKVLVMDEPGQGNACHEYNITRSELTPADFERDATIPDEFARIKFQNGPVKEFGVNGCHQEDLLAIVIDRLQSFQNSEFKCQENAIALTKIQEALHWLQHRTSDRASRGVEGTHQL